MAGHSDAVRNLVADAIGGAFDGGSGRINVYTGSKPASPATAATGTLLATLSLSSDAFGAATSGVITANAITGDSAADASGQAGWARVWRTGDTAPGSAGGASDRRIDLTVSGTGGGGEMQFADINFVQGAAINLTSFSWTAFP